MLPCVDLLTEHSEALRLHLQVNQTSVAKNWEKQKRHEEKSVNNKSISKICSSQKYKEKEKFKKSLNKNRDNFYIGKI